MESRLYIRKAVHLIFFLFMLRVAHTHAETRQVEAVDIPSGSIANDYFFYQQSEYPRDCQEVLRGCQSLNSSGIYFIKPDGYSEPFEVYCDNEVNSSGWTVIQRRLGGSIEFDRLWDDYKTGFGFLSHGFWLGNDKLSYITNQAVYELRVDMQLSNGSSLYVSYSGFRIGDEWAKYAIVALGEYHSHGDGSITSCPDNMVFGNCTCQSSCEEPGGCHRNCSVGSGGCFCPEGFFMSGDDCLPPSECPCYWSEINRVIANNHTVVNDDCTERRTCNGNELVRDGEYRCGPNAQCQTKDGERRCYCNDGFQGDWHNCDVLYTDCYDAYTAGNRQDGLYLIKPVGWNETAFTVPCVMSTHEGGWTVFQRRNDTNRQVNFYRNWTSYRGGFGAPPGDFWLGNEKIHFLTNQKPHKLRVDAVGSRGTAIYGEWSSFSVGTEEDKYRLTVTGHSGNTVTMQYNNGKAFSTYDEDNDECERHKCAEKHRGGWWYYDKSCSSSLSASCHSFAYGSSNTHCTLSNPNGEYSGGNGENIFFRGSHSDGCNLQSVEMKIRPTN